MLQSFFHRHHHKHRASVEKSGEVSQHANVEVHEIANMALYLASPFEAALSGQAISICRGVEMLR